MSTTDRPSSQALPAYFVSSRHRTRGGEDGGQAGWKPFGVQHARKPGAPLTACGRLALDWRIFWEIPFPQDPEASCPDCRTACGKPLAAAPARDAAVGGAR